MKLAHFRNLVFIGCTLLATVAYGIGDSFDKGIRIEGKVTAIDPLVGELTVGNQMVQTTAQTRYETGGFYDIAVGARLDVEGAKSWNGKELRVMATKVARR